jgi:hypothetical protein
MQIQRNKDIALPEAFYQLLEQRLQSVGTEQANIITLNFSDPNYHADSGGYHPVEIGLVRHGAHWELNYMTDFAYFGRVYPELEKEIDVCFQQREVFSSYAGTQYLQQASGLVRLLIDNFLGYIALGVYVEKVTID